MKEDYSVLKKEYKNTQMPKIIYKNKVVKIVEYKKYLILRCYVGVYKRYDILELDNNFIKTYKRLDFAKKFAEKLEKQKGGK